jgi:hypothetical protein
LIEPIMGFQVTHHGQEKEFQISVKDKDETVSLITVRGMILNRIFLSVCNE